MPHASALHAFVLAGGAGSRLQPLTGSRCKPALPFGGNFRVVDFVLGNLLNSGVANVDLLVQYQPQALVAHVRELWAQRFARAGGRIEVLSPRLPHVGFRGTADAVRQHLDRLPGRAGLALVFGADHVYRMDVRPMLALHRARGAACTVATLPVALEDASAFGIVGTDPDGRARRFDEKPARPRVLPGRPDRALASMGNYVFDTDVLRRALARRADDGELDFGHHVLPGLIDTQRVFAYDFAAHHVPGALPGEEPAYWRDVGTLDAYFAAHLDTLGPVPRFNLDNPRWPLAAAADQGAPPLVVRSEVRHACIAADAVVDGARLERVVVGRGARIERDAQLERCVVMDGATVGAGARLRDVIVDADNTIPAGTSIGLDAAQDAQRFVRTAGGVVVVPRGCFGDVARSAPDGLRFASHA